MHHLCRPETLYPAGAAHTHSNWSTMYTGVGIKEARGASGSPIIFVWRGPGPSKNWANAILKVY